MEEYVVQFHDILGVLLSSVFIMKLVFKKFVINPVTNYFAFDEKMMASAHIFAANSTDEGGPFVDAFIADINSAWDKIAAIFLTQKAWTYAHGTCKS